MKIFHVILTGGVGSRLWPLSRKSRPKQYLNLFSDFSLFELAIERNKRFADHLIVVGNKDNHHLSQNSLRKLGENNYINIIEATPRNTAPAIAFAAFAAKPEDILIVTPADHIIKEGDEYDKAIKKAIDLASNGAIVTFGVKPTKPETGYGYIEHEGEEVISFREKPNAETATEFLKSDKFLWNSGMFCFQAGVFLDELEKFVPEVFNNSKEAWRKSDDGELEMNSSLEIPSISVDYAVMEKSDKIKVVAADFEWSDMGSFEAVYDYLKDQNHPMDTNGNLVLGTEKFTGFIGLKNCIFISTSDANLILQKEESQKVKSVYQDLEEKKSNLIE